jgi:uncharacterized protein (DUF2461 family)
MKTKEEMKKIKRQRYNLHYNLKKKGYKINAHKKTIYLPYDFEDVTNPQIKKLTEEHGYAIQLFIY